MGARLGYVDLTKHTIHDVTVGNAVASRFLGGRGLGAAILHRHDLGSEPLSEESLCCILRGALTGTAIPLANRLAFVFRSPATRTIACANTGRHVAVALQNAGFGGLVLRGRAERP